MPGHVVVSSLLVCLAVARVAPHATAPAKAAETRRTTGCLACHQGIEPIREAGSEMLEEILALGRSRGNPDGCVVCHGGDPIAKEKDPAHQGKAFYPDPGSPWINQKTCGVCHPDHWRVQWHSLMMTEAGKIQGVCWTFGSLHRKYGAPTGYHHLWGNYAVRNPDLDDPRKAKLRLGTDAYRAYMEQLGRLEDQVFVARHLPLPDAPAKTDLVVTSGARLRR